MTTDQPQVGPASPLAGAESGAAPGTEASTEIGAAAGASVAPGSRLTRWRRGFKNRKAKDTETGPVDTSLLSTADRTSDEAAAVIPADDAPQASGPAKPGPE